MILTIIPQWGRGAGSYHVDGDVLTVNGTAYDLSDIPEGGEGHWHPAPGEDHLFIGPIRRIDGVLHATVLGWLGEDAEPDQPDAPWIIDAEGAVEIPYARLAQPEQEDGDDAADD